MIRDYAAHSVDRASGEWMCTATETKSCVLPADLFGSHVKQNICGSQTECHALNDESAGVGHQANSLLGTQNKTELTRPSISFSWIMPS